MPTLKLIIGPMFAGKTTELLRHIRMLKVINKQYLIIKPIIDNRTDDLSIVSHDFDKQECIKLSSLQDIYREDLRDIDTIFIDEGQFFDDLKEIVVRLLEKDNKNIIISGLVGDYNRNKFGQILDLIPYGAEILQVNALCLHCMDGTNALFSHRKTNSDEQVLIGAKDEYVSLCRKHYLENSS
jgi:thymidine kinase